MSEDKRLETLQGEVKLLKGELKNSLASVRDYLLNMELPASEFSTILAALSGEGNNGQKMSMEGNLGNNPLAPPETAKDEAGLPGDQPAEDELPPEDEDLIDVDQPPEDMADDLAEDNALGEDSALAEDGALAPEDEMVEEEDGLNPEDAVEEETTPEDALEEEALEADAGDEVLPEDDPALDLENELPEEDLPMGADLAKEDIAGGVPRVNMLANLINWTARARREIGADQLAAFLEVYGISGHLTPELKEVILHLSEMTQDDPDAVSAAEIWSQSMLSLHGILTGGDAPLHPVFPGWGDAKSPEEAAAVGAEKNQDKPVKLKFVFPNGNGKSKEFSLDLTPDADEDDEL